jgi:hypothetical protein
MQKKKNGHLTNESSTFNKYVRVLHKRKKSKSEGLLDAATHSEHGLLVKCDILPRSTEIVRIDLCLAKFNKSVRALHIAKDRM